MARYADLDRRRKKQILVNQRANFLTLEALARATGFSLEDWSHVIALRATDHVDRCNDLEIDAVIAHLDSQYDDTTL